MRVYLDVSCYNRPFDDQSQVRVRLETEAIQYVFEQYEVQGWELIVSEVTLFEMSAILDEQRRLDVLSLLPESGTVITINSVIQRRATQLAAFRINPADALHVAA